MEKVEFFCYILECADGSYYTGWSKNPVRRCKQHNAGRGAKYTRSHRPVRLVYIEAVENQADAMRREHIIKTYTRTQKIKLIEGHPYHEPE